MDLNSQNLLCKKPGWQQAWEVEANARGTWPPSLVESVSLEVQWWNSISKVKEEGTCGIVPEDDLWPSHALAHVMTKTDPSPCSLKETERAPSLPIKIGPGVSSGGKRRMGILWLGGSSFKVTVVKNNMANSRNHQVPQRTQKAALASASVFTERDFGLLVLCKRLLNSRSSQCLFRELLDLSRSHKITQTLGA